MIRLLLGFTVIAGIFLWSPVRDSTTSSIGESGRTSSWPSITPSRTSVSAHEGNTAAVIRGAVQDIAASAGGTVPIEAVRRIALQQTIPLEMPPLRR